MFSLNAQKQRKILPKGFFLLILLYTSVTHACGLAPVSSTLVQHFTECVNTPLSCGQRAATVAPKSRGFITHVQSTNLHGTGNDWWSIHGKMSRHNGIIHSAKPWQLVAPWLIYYWCVITSRASQCGVYIIEKQYCILFKRWLLWSWCSVRWKPI